MSEGYVSGVGGKKTASGSIPAPVSGTLLLSVSLDFTPKKVTLYLPVTSYPYSANGILMITHDFDTAKGLLIGLSSGSAGMVFLYTDTDYRPTFSDGVLTFRGKSSGYKFTNTLTSTYEWFATE